MKRFLFILIFLLIPILSFAASKMYWGTGLTGGGAAVDGVDGNLLAAGDGAVGLIDNAGTPVFYFYRLYADGATADGVTVITPATNAGTKRWHLASIYTQAVTVPKASGVAGTVLLYEANSTDTNGTGWKGPASRASDLYLQFPDADPTANQILLFPAPTTGTSTASWQNYGQAVEVNGSTDATLTAAQVSGTIIYNTGQAAADVTLTLPTAAAGYNFIATVYTARANKWGVRAGTNDLIYLIAADGSVSKGSNNGYARMTNAVEGQSFACWTVKTDAYDWMCKAISIAGNTFAAN